MTWIAKLIEAAKLARVVAPVVRDAVAGAVDLAEARERLARAAERGDLDDAVAVARKTASKIREAAK